MAKKNMFYEALKRQGFKYSARKGGMYHRLTDNTISMSMSTAVLKLDREMFPLFINMDPARLREEVRKVSDLHGEDIVFMEITLKPYLVALLEAS